MSNITELTPIGDEILYATSSTSLSLSSISAYSRSLLATTSQATARSNLGLTPGTDVQSYVSS